MRVLFGTDGIRGKAAQYPLDPPTMFALGEALAHRFRRIIMGMDTRESGPDIARALSAGIVAGEGEDLVRGNVRQHLASAARPLDLQAVDCSRPPQAEVDGKRALRRIAVAKDGIGVALCAYHACVTIAFIRLCA